VAAHRIDGATMAPAAWTLSVLAARREGAAVANVLWQRRIDDPDTVEVRERDGELSLVDRVTGAVHCTAEPAAPAAVPAPAAGSVPPGARRLYGPDIYAAFRRLGYDYGAPLRGLRWAEVGPGAARAFVHVDHDWGYDLSPALLDSGMQLSVLLAAEDDPGAGVFVPYHLGRLTVVRAPRDEAVFCHCVARPGGASRRTRTYDFWFTDADGEVLVTLEEAVSVAVDGLRPPQPPAPEPAPFTVFELN
jgi:polyketide synthase PksM/polyketide synthase PksN